MKNIYELIRPYHYIKNLFIFLPLFFGAKMMDFHQLLNTVIAFIAFSFVASGVYVLNDYHDIEEDRIHPTKKKRPLASGAISKGWGILIMLILFIAGFTTMALLSIKTLPFLGAYVVMNIAYSFYLKQIDIIDIMIIATGFVLRLFIGSSVTGIVLSKWIVLMTFLLALFMALAKRRDDVVIFMKTGKKMRAAVKGYNLQFFDIAMSTMASVVIVTYILYTVFPGDGKIQNDYLYTTVIFVILGILRYMKLTFIMNDTGSPTRIILKDRFLKIVLLGWLISFVWIIYF